MRLVRMFKTSDMPKEVWEHFKNCGSFVHDGVGKYHVGYYVDEAANADDPDEYPASEIAGAKLTDEWFISNGAVPNCTVYVEHG